jgi:hypothetical protein
VQTINAIISRHERSPSMNFIAMEENNRKSIFYVNNGKTSRNVSSHRTATRLVDVVPLFVQFDNPRPVNLLINILFVCRILTIRQVCRLIRSVSIGYRRRSSIILT